MPLKGRDRRMTSVFSHLKIKIKKRSKNDKNKKKGGKTRKKGGNEVRE